MPEPMIIKQCRKVIVSFFNAQGFGRKLVRICYNIQNGQNGPEILTAPFLDTGESLFIAIANLLDMIFI